MVEGCGFGLLPAKTFWWKSAFPLCIAFTAIFCVIVILYEAPFASRLFPRISFIHAGLPINVTDFCIKHRDFYLSRKTRRIVFEKENTKQNYFPNVTANKLLVYNNTSDKMRFCQTQPFLVFYCSLTGGLCGGLGDRQNGLVSSYLLSLLLQRPYAIVMDKPCPLSTFLAENEVSWAFCSEYLETPSPGHLYNFIDRREWKTTIPDTLFSDSLKGQVLHIMVNNLWLEGTRKHPAVMDRIPWMAKLNDGQVIAEVLRKLFVPKQRLQNELQALLPTRKGLDRLICAHIRLTKNPSNPLDDFHSDRSDPTIMLGFMKKIFQPNDTVYIASDSDEVKYNAYRMFQGNSLYFCRPSIHIDRFNMKDKEAACEGLFTALLDQTILSNCDVLLLSKSGFGRYAAYLRRTSDNLFCFDPIKYSVVPCVFSGYALSEIRYIYQ